MKLRHHPWTALYGFISNFSIAVTNNVSPAAFTYSPTRHARRHGPVGYRDYQSYRPFLRDDFSFRCAYCLMREQWGRVSGDFELDHFVPQVQSPGRAADYENLVYCCHRCNLRKGSQELPDSMALTAADVHVLHDGRIVGESDDAQRIIAVLELNSPKLIRWRLVWIRNIKLAEKHHPIHYRDLMRYPDDLPDLSKLKPPSNTRPDGIEESCFARRERGSLQETYLF